MPEDPKALGEVELVVLRGGVVGIDVEKRIVVAPGSAEGSAACSVARGGAGHHVADGGPEVPRLGVDERQPLPDVARHVERAVDGRVPLRPFHDAGSRPSPGLVQLVGGFESGDLSHLDCRRGVRGGQILDQDGVVGECGIIRPVVHVRGDGVDGCRLESLRQPARILPHGLAGDLTCLVAHDLDSLGSCRGRLL